MNKLIVFFLLMMSLPVWAQTTGGTTIDSLTVLKETQINVEDANKKNVDPTLEEPSAPALNFTYAFPDFTYKPRAVYSPIDPVYLKPETEGDYSDNYIEIGLGNYFTSYLDARIHNTKDKYYTYGLNLRHQAASRSKNPYQGTYSFNRIQAFGTREKGSTLTGELDFQRNVIHYYGYVDTAEYNLRDIAQTYNDLNAKVLWEANLRNFESSLNFGFNVFNKKNANEFTAELLNINEFRTGQGRFFLELGGTYTLLNQSNSYQRIFIDIYPHQVFRYKKADIDAGFNLTTFVDSNPGKFFFVPVINIETYLVPDKLRAYAGFGGGLKKNTLRSFSYENFFLGDDLNIQNTFELIDLYMGMNGSFKRFIEFAVEMRQSFVRNQFLFVNDTNDLRNMQVLYDSFSVFTFKGELKFDINENVDIGFVGKFYSYSNNTQQFPWHLPTYDIKVFASLRLVEKMYLSASYYGISARQATNLAGEQVKLKPIQDLNLGVEYRYKKNISGFINIQNLLNQRYFLWNNYKAQGINVLAGVTFSI